MPLPTIFPDPGDVRAAELADAERAAARHSSPAQVTGLAAATAATAVHRVEKGRTAIDN